MDIKQRMLGKGNEKNEKEIKKPGHTTLAGLLAMMQWWTEQKDSFLAC